MASGTCAICGADGGGWFGKSLFKCKAPNCPTKGEKLMCGGCLKKAKVSTTVWSDDRCPVCKVGQLVNIN